MSRVWSIENALLDIYFLLAHRIEGLGWSLADFWKMDTWTTSKFYLRELDLIDEEDRKMKNKKYHDPKEENDPEVTKTVIEMFGDEI